MSGSDVKRLKRLSKAELIEQIMERREQEESDAASPASLYEVKSRVDYTQFFPRPDREDDDVVLPALGTAPLPGDMLHDKNLRQAIEDGTVSEPYKVEEYTLPPKEIEPPAHLKLDNPRDLEAAKNILAANEWGRILVAMMAPSDARTHRPNLAFLQKRLLPILYYVRYMDQQTHQLPKDLREALIERIKEIEVSY